MRAKHSWLLFNMLYNVHVILNASRVSIYINLNEDGCVVPNCETNCCKEQHAQYYIQI